MTFNRRAFLRSSSLAALAVAFVPNWASAAQGGRGAVSVRTVPLGTADQAVLDWVKTYSSQVRLVGGGVVSRLYGAVVGLRVLAEISDMAALETALTGTLPFSDIRAQGNVLSFSLDGVSFTIENLMPDLFAKQLSALNAAKKVAFAHEALSYDPATQRLSDPLKAAKSGTLKLVHPGSDLPTAFRTLLRSWIEADELNLELGPSFNQLKKRVLSVRGKRLGLAQPVVATLVEQLTALAEALPAEKIEAILRSPLVSTAISRILGVDANTVIAQFAELRSQLEGEIADATAWLASLLSQQLVDSTLPDWLSGLDAVKTYRARAALAEAREIAQRRLAGSNF